MQFLLLQIFATAKTIEQIKFSVDQIFFTMNWTYDVLPRQHQFVAIAITRNT